MSAPLTQLLYYYYQLSADALSTAVKVVYHDIFAKLTGCGIEGATTIDARQLVYEVDEI